MLKLDIKRNAIRGTGIPNGSKLKELAHMSNLTPRPYATQLEIWRDIVGYEGIYQVSSLGNIKRIHKSRHPPKGNMKFSSTRGYWSIGLTKNCKKTTFQVHRLIAIAFIEGKTDKRNTVNHINGIKTDNRLENLEWCTQAENLKHARATGLTPPMKSDCHLAKLTWDQVHEIRKLNENGLSTRKLARQFTVCRSTIQSILHNRSWRET